MYVCRSCNPDDDLCPNCKCYYCYVPWKYKCFLCKWKLCDCNANCIGDVRICDACAEDEVRKRRGKRRRKHLGYYKE